MITLAAVKKSVLYIVALLVVAVFGITGCGSGDEAIVEIQINESVEDNIDLTLEFDSGSDNEPVDDDGSVRHDDNEPESHSSGSVIISEPLTVKVFAADDVAKSVSQAVLESLNLAADMWGLYWPVEYWVLGLDPVAGEALVSEFCTRRDSRDEWEYGECMRREAGPEQHSMIEYQQLGAQAVAEDSPFGSAGLNGTPEWGIHRFATTLPWGLAGRFGTPGDEDVKTVLHEYWHAVQHSFITTLDHDKRNKIMGPVWFVEGSAEFMAQYGAAQLADQERMPKVPKGDFPFSYEEQMANKLHDIENEFSNGCAGRNLSSIIEYSDPCSGVGYALGAWAIAHLLSGTDVDALLKNFHPIVENVGWEKAFEAVFGRTVTDLDKEIKRFWELPESEKMAILPRP
jgi:hypothetical protein